MTTDGEIKIHKPTSVLLRPLELDFQGFFKSLAKAGVHFAFGNLEGLSTDALDAMQSIGLKEDAGALGWLLLWRGMTNAVVELCNEVAQKHGDLDDNEALNLSREIEKALEAPEIVINRAFFERPEQLPVVDKVARVLQHRLQALGVPEPNSQATASRLRSYFVFALAEEWRNRDAVYKKILDATETPFDPTNDREKRWLAYYRLLERELDRPILDESFGLREVLIRLRAYYVEKHSDEEEGDTDPRREVAKQICHVGWLDETLNAWVEQANKDDAIRVITGGPGSGKSCFARWYAAQQTTNRCLRVVYVPLHLFDPKGDLSESLDAYCKDHPLLPTNLLDAKNGERLLVVFDGLDELSKQGRVAAETANQFVEEVQKETGRLNALGLRVQIMLSGRPVAIQSCEQKFRKEGALLHLLPYHILKDDEARKEYVDPFKCLKGDQRDDWWKKYGRAKGIDYRAMPEELKKNGRQLDEITAQPLLNYLIALTYQRGKIDFTEQVDLNKIYADLLAAVYERKYEGQPVQAIKDMSKANFERLLEEIGLSAWHGDGRTTTVDEIRSHCEHGGLSRLLQQFEDDAKAGVTRLLTAFYFQRHGRRTDGEHTFEFTHKSFGEYLTARRIVRAFKRISTQLQRRRDDPDDGWGHRDALEFWVGVCGPTALDTDLLGFIHREVVLMDRSDVGQWQSDISDLLTHAVTSGMPMEKVTNEKGFREATGYARNAEEALLALHYAIARRTKERGDVRWPAERSAEALIKRLTPVSGIGNGIALHSLGYLSFDEQLISMVDLSGANLESTSWRDAELTGVRLVGVDLHGADLRDVRWCGCEIAFALLDAVIGQPTESSWITVMGFPTDWPLVEGGDDVKVHIGRCDTVTIGERVPRELYIDYFILERFWRMVAPAGVDFDATKPIAMWYYLVRDIAEE